MAKFCSECGGPLANETSKFCDTCGARIGDIKNNGKNQVLSAPQTVYSTNYILILLLVGWFLFLFVAPIVSILIVVVSAICVYLDAKSINAGKHADKETMVSITWSPTTWALLVLFLWILLLPFYLIKRKEIFFS
jgi:hypothetical protein